MRFKLIIIFVCLVNIYSISSQTLVKNGGRLAAFDTHVIVFFSKPIALSNSSLGSSKKYLAMNYQPQKLPFFCAMEEKCRNKFNVFLKLRAGNDESYMKMITNPNR